MEIELEELEIIIDLLKANANLLDGGDSKEYLENLIKKLQTFIP